jgi:hypothetical protein
MSDFFDSLAIPRLSSAAQAGNMTRRLQRSPRQFRRAAVEPKVIGTFTATGEDGERYTVEIVKEFHQIGGGWAKDRLADFRTDDGLEVGCVSEQENGYFFVVTTGVKLFPDIPLQEVMEIVLRHR